MKEFKKYSLFLYYFPGCPFCHFVLDVIEKLKLQVSLVNIHEDNKSREKLYKDTGRYTVPCLYINDEPMHESQDIINWLVQNKDKLEKSKWRTLPYL